MALVEVRNVTKTYTKGDETITPLDAVDLDLESGEFVSLMGASGTGKSTLLNLIASIDFPDSGTITVDGVEITAVASGEQVVRCAMLFKKFNQITALGRSCDRQCAEFDQHRGVVRAQGIHVGSQFDQLRYEFGASLVSRFPK